MEAWRGRAAIDNCSCVLGSLAGDGRAALVAVLLPDDALVADGESRERIRRTGSGEDLGRMANLTSDDLAALAGSARTDDSPSSHRWAAMKLGSFHPVAGVDLTHPRSLGELLRTTFGLWFRHLPVFFALALLAVAPYEVLVEGLWVGRIDDPNALGSVTAWLASFLLQAFVVPSFVTAVHVIAVQDLARGQRPGVIRSIRLALPVLWPVIIVEALYTLWLLLGLLLLIVGALYFGVRYYFAAQAAVVDGERGMSALRASGDLVGDWWARTLGLVTLIYVLSAVFTAPLWVLHSGWTYIAAAVPGVALSMSFTALAATLLFFDLKARQAHPGGG